MRLYNHLLSQFNLKQENFNFRKIFRNIIFFSFLFIYQIINSQVEVKTNLLTSIVLVPNFGVEIKVKKKSSLQVDFLGSFWDSVEPLNNSPFHVNQNFIEYRTYQNENLTGFFYGPNIGYGMFTMQKPNFAIIYDHWRDKNSSSSDDDSYKSGRAAFYGITLGYKKKIGKNFALEAFIGAGLTQSVYRSYEGLIRTDFNEDRPRDFDKSGEVAIYKGGLMLVYKFNSKKKQ